MSGIPGTPKKGRRFTGDAAHQKAMFGNLVASFIALISAFSMGRPLASTPVAQLTSVQGVAEIREPFSLSST